MSEQNGHPPPDDEIERQLEQARLEVLKHLEQAKSFGAGWLFAARDTGLWLEESFRLRKLQPEKQRWEEWVDQNFHLKRRTADDYRAIAKHWDDPRLQEARKNGTEFTSMNQVFAILRAKEDEDPDEDEKPDLCVYEGSDVGEDAVASDDPAPLDDPNDRAPSPGRVVFGVIHEDMEGLHPLEQEVFADVFTEYFGEWFELVRWEMVSRVAEKYPGCYEEVLIDEDHELMDVRFVPPSTA